MTKEEALRFIRAIFKNEDSTSSMSYNIARKDACNVRRWSTAKKKSRVSKEPLIVKKKS